MVSIISEDNLSYEFINGLKSDDLLVYSPTSIRLHKITLPRDTKTLSSGITGIDKNNIDCFISSINAKDINRIVVFGSGKTINIAKYIAGVLNLNLVCIPSVISTNSFATNKVCLLNNGLLETLESVAPNLVIIDYNLILQSKSEMNLYGVAEILSFHTALKDWELAQNAKQEIINPFFYNLGYFSLNQLLTNLNEFNITSRDTVKFITELLFLSGFMVNMYGSGRPQSGSEHIFARQLETYSCVPHGLAVSLGILIMSYAQKNNSDMFFSVINRLGLLNNLDKYHINIGIIKATLSSIKPRPNRYTILNEVNNKIWDGCLKALKFNIFK